MIKDFGFATYCRRGHEKSIYDTSVKLGGECIFCSSPLFLSLKNAKKLPQLLCDSLFEMNALDEMKMLFTLLIFRGI